MSTNKPIPEHVVEQRKRAAAEHTAMLRRPKERSEMYDVFRRINMHNGEKEPCWEWRGAHGKGTRGEYRPRVRIANKDYYVYRVVYELYTGYKLQADDVVRHTCDHSWCCNPYHMLIGKQADNVADMLERERVGIKLYHVKRIMQMLELGCSAVYVCEHMRPYGITLDASVVRKIRMRRIYRHVQWPWGDNYATERRQRLAMLRQQRVASDPTSAILQDTIKTTGGDNGEGQDQS